MLVNVNNILQNRNVPGDLKLSDDEIATLGAQDVNNWFELAVEMLDYLDDILQLQALGAFDFVVSIMSVKKHYLQRFFK